MNTLPVASHPNAASLSPLGSAFPVASHPNAASVSPLGNALSVALLGNAFAVAPHANALSIAIAPPGPGAGARRATVRHRRERHA